MLAGYQNNRHVNDPNDRATEAGFFLSLHERFAFSVDVAANERNAKLPRYYTVAQDGLSQSWADEGVWCNPPYSSIQPWVEKAWVEWRRARVIVMLLPADRTEQLWWQQLVEPFRDRPASPLRVEFLSGRLRFIKPGRDTIGPGERPPFGCCLLIWQTLAAPAIHFTFRQGDPHAPVP